MNVIVAYASRLGSTRAIAERIADRLRGEAVSAIASEVGSLESLALSDALVIGSAVYEGHWLPEAKAFVRQVATTSPERPVWLFSSGPVGRTAAAKPADPADVPELEQVTHARGHRSFGGALDRQTVDGSRLSFPERLIAKHLVPEGDFRDWSQIDAWADEIARDLLARAPAH